MHNEGSLNEASLVDSNSLPPPYYTSIPHQSEETGSNNLNLNVQSEVGLSSNASNIDKLQLKIVTSSPDSWQMNPYESSCVLEDRFLLLGYHDSIQVIDLTIDMKPKPIMSLFRAKQMVPIESCRTVLILAGRYRQTRCYSYDALLKLVYTTLELEWDQRLDTDHDVPHLQEWDQMASQSGKAPDETSQAETIEVNGSGIKDRFRDKKRDERSTSPFLAETSLLSNALSKPFKKKTTLGDYYYKLPDSRDAIGVQTYQTSTYVFIALQHKDKIVLWQKKKDHPLRPFYRLKVFWIPMETRSVAFADDRSSLRHLIAVFQSEATVIELRSSKVQTIPIDPALERIYQTNWVRDQYDQMNSPRSPHSPIPNTIRNHQETETHPSQTHYHTLPNNLSVPPIQWTSLIQLPFYPDDLPATTLTVDYSIPPSYHTVISSHPSSAAPDPVALPSVSAPQLFFATLSKQSYIIDMTGHLFSTQCFRWSESPVHIEFIQLKKNDWCVIGFGPETVELIHLKNVNESQRVMHGAPVKFLGRWDIPLKKKNSIFRSIFWSCSAHNERTHVYMLKVDDLE